MKNVSDKIKTVKSAPISKRKASKPTESTPTKPVASKAKPAAAPSTPKAMTWDDPRYQAFSKAFCALIDGLPDNDPRSVDRFHLMTSAGFIVELAIGTGKMDSTSFAASLQGPLARVNAANASL